MANEPIVFSMPTEMKIIEIAPSEAAQPAPSANPGDADTTFSREQGEIVSALLAAQVGLGLLHNLAVETFQRAEEQPIPPRRREKEEEPK